MSHIIDRIRIIRSIAALILAAIISSGFAAKVHAAEDLIIATWGGSWADIFNATMNDPFTAETGIKTKIIPGVSMTNYKLIAAQRDNPQVDIVIIAGERANVAARQGLFEPFTEREVPNIKNILPAKNFETSDGKYLYAGVWGDSVILAYRHDLVPFEITRWLDLWDSRMKGKVGITSPKIQEGRFLLMINQIMGGDENNVDPGFKKIKELGDNLVMVADTDAEQMRALAQGEIWAVPMQMASAVQAIADGVPLKWVAPAEGATTTDALVAIVKGAPHMDAAKQYVNFILSHEIVKSSAVATSQSPLLHTPGKISPEAEKFTLQAADMNKLMNFDYAAITANIGDWLERWQREISPLVAQ